MIMTCCVLGMHELFGFLHVAFWPGVLGRSDGHGVVLLPGNELWHLSRRTDIGLNMCHTI